MSIKGMYNVVPMGNTLDTDTMDFVKYWHYSRSCRSMKQKYVFKLVDHMNSLIGVAIYGQPMGTHCSPTALELRRFCLVDDTPRNTESFFLSRTLAWLARFQTEYDHVLTF